MKPQYGTWEWPEEMLAATLAHDHEHFALMYEAHIRGPDDLQDLLDYVGIRCRMSKEAMWRCLDEFLGRRRQ